MTSSVSQNFFLLNILSRCIKITLKILLLKFKKIQNIVLCRETFSNLIRRKLNLVLIF